MSSTNISVKDEAIRFLNSLKGKDESYSDVILKFKEKNASNGKALLRFAGTLREIDWDEREKSMKEFRESFEKRIEETVRYREEVRKKK